MKKLISSDITLLGEGKQLRMAIDKINPNLLDFYNRSSIPIAFSTFKSYLSKDKVISDTFKYSVTKELNTDFNELVKSKKEQLKEFVYSIFDNVKLYNTELDMKTIDLVLALCQKYKFSLETALMYRAKAKNLYYRNKMNQAVEFYEYSIKTVPLYDKSKIVFLYSELADMYSRENIFLMARKHFTKAKEYITSNKIDKEALFTFNYYIGIMYYFSKNYSIAKEHFVCAFENSTKLIEKAASTSNIGLMFKKEENYSKALEYYNEVLSFLNEDMTAQKISVYNNIAEVYRMLNDYSNAIKYIDLSFECMDNKNTFDRYLIHIETYTEIQLQLNSSYSCDKYFDTLLQTRNNQIDKHRILLGIKNIVTILENVELLDRLSNIIINLIQSASNNKDYCNDLYKFLGMIYEKIKKLGGKI